MQYISQQISLNNMISSPKIFTKLPQGDQRIRPPPLPKKTNNNENECWRSMQDKMMMATTINHLLSKLSYLNFQTLKVVSHYRDPQL